MRRNFFIGAVIVFITLTCLALILAGTFLVNNLGRSQTPAEETTEEAVKDLPAGSTNVSENESPEEFQYYTNDNYPGLKIAYLPGWNLVDGKNPANLDGFNSAVNTEVIFLKDGYKLRYKIFAREVWGGGYVKCYKAGEIEYKKIDEDLTRFSKIGDSIINDYLYLPVELVDRETELKQFEEENPESADKPNTQYKACYQTSDFLNDTVFKANDSENKAVAQLIVTLENGIKENPEIVSEADRMVNALIGKFNSDE